MKYCSNCGSAIEDDAKFCPNCGAMIDTDPVIKEEPAPAASAPEEIAPAPAAAPVTGSAPADKLRTNRGLLKFILLSMITFGIYGIVVLSHNSKEINQIASRYDGKKTMHYCLVAFIFSWLTLGIVPIVWFHRLSGRIGTELGRRGIDYKFGSRDFWLWNVLGALIVVGPFVYMHKFFHSMNLLCADYNVNG